MGLVVAFKLDRISRSLRDGINVLCEWIEKGLRVVCTSQQIDFSGTLGSMRRHAAFQFGEIRLQDVLTDPVDRALLVFRAPDRSVVEQFVQNDPYVTSGLVTGWEVRSWANVLGDDVADAGAKAV
jgi:hypothetical protein